MVSSIRGGKYWPWRAVDNEAGFPCLAQMGCWRENRGPSSPRELERPRGKGPFRLITSRDE
jgi:hypothetical protein